MKVRLIAAVLALAAAAMSFAQGPPVASVRVLSSNGVKAAIEELRPAAERAIGKPLAIEFSTTTSLKQRVESGEAFDVALLTREAMDDLAKKARISGASRAGLARSGVGVGYRKGAAKPNVATSAAIKQTLLRAKSVAFTADGASRATIDKMFESLGIAKEMDGKTYLEAAGQAPLRVAEGKAELVLTLVSDILPVPGVELAGPLPASFQNYIVFEAGVSPSARAADAGKALVQFLSSPAAAKVFAAKGMEAAK